MSNLGELKTVDPRQVWPNEARDFTPWLAKNIQKLGEALGMDLVIEEEEAHVGEFSLDLLAKDLSTGRVVVIENQLTATDHDHLGKLLTYAGGYDALVVVWVATEIRDEHRKALEWLNERTDTQTAFFGVIVELLQVDDSKPAVNIKPVVSPNPFQKDIKGRRLEEVTEREEKYQQFFQSLLDELREKHRFTRAKVAQPQNWYSFTSGNRNFWYSISFTARKRFRVEVYLDSGDKDQTKRNFDALYGRKAQIENLVGEELTWERLDNRRASRIAVYRDGSIDDDDQKLAEARQWAIAKLLLFHKVFGKGIESLVGGGS